MVLIPDVQNGQSGQLTADLSDQFWPVQSRHRGVRDEKSNGSEAEREFIGREAVVGLIDTVIGLSEGAHHGVEQRALFVERPTARRPYRSQRRWGTVPTTLVEHAALPHFQP